MYRVAITMNSQTEPTCSRDILMTIDGRVKIKFLSTQHLVS